MKFVKRFMATVLSIVMILSICAISSSAEKLNDTFSVVGNMYDILEYNNELENRVYDDVKANSLDDEITDIIVDFLEQIINIEPTYLETPEDFLEYYQSFITDLFVSDVFEQWSYFDKVIQAKEILSMANREIKNCDFTFWAKYRIVFSLFFTFVGCVFGVY